MAYYATQSGIGAKDGSLAAPWALAGVNWTTCSGDTLYVMGAITGTVTPNVSGTSDAVRTVIRGDYAGQEAVLTTSSHGFSLSSVSNFTIMNFSSILVITGRAVRIVGDASNILIDNLTGTGSATAQTIQYDGFGDNLEVKNCILSSGYDCISFDGDGSGDVTNVSIHDNSLTDCGRHGITVTMQNADTYTATDIDIYNNTILRTGVTTSPDWTNGNGIRVWRESINSGARLSTVNIYDNNISYTGGIGIANALSDIVNVYGNTCNEISATSNGQGVGLYGTTNFSIHDNTLSNIYTDSATHDGHGVDLDYQTDGVSATNYICTDGYVYRNKISNTGNVEFSPGINLLSTDSVICYGNIIINSVNGIKVAQRGGGGVAEIPQNNVVSNNTFIAGVNSVYGLRFNSIAATQQTEYDSNILSNNIIIGFDNAVIVLAGDGDLTTADYNLYYDNTANETHSGTGAITSTGEVVATTNPINTDYTLPENSEAVGAGTKWWGNAPRPDSLGEPLPDMIIDIGAYQSIWSANHPINLSTIAIYEDSIYGETKDTTVSWLSEELATGVNVIKIANQTVDVYIGFTTDPYVEPTRWINTATASPMYIRADATYVAWKSSSTGTFTLKQSVAR